MFGFKSWKQMRALDRYLREECADFDLGMGTVFERAVIVLAGRETALVRARNEVLMLRQKYEPHKSQIKRTETLRGGSRVDRVDIGAQGTAIRAQPSGEVLAAWYRGEVVQMLTNDVGGPGEYGDSWKDYKGRNLAPCPMAHVKAWRVKPVPTAPREEPTPMQKRESFEDNLVAAATMAAASSNTPWYPSVERTSAPPMRSGGGGDYAGAGAEGSWEEPAKPQPVMAAVSTDVEQGMYVADPPPPPPPPPAPSSDSGSSSDSSSSSSSTTTSD